MTDEKFVLKAHTCDDEIVKRIQTILHGSDRILSDLHLQINADGISMRQLDTSKAALVIWELPSSVFSVYEYDHEDKEIVICLEAKALKRAVDTAKDRLEFQLDKETTGGRFTVSSYSDFKHVERLGLLRPMDKMAKKPSLPPGDVVYTIDGKVFRKVLLAASKVGSYVRMAVLNSKMLIETESGESDDQYSAELESNTYDCIFNIERFTKMADTFYAMNYLHEFRFFIQNKDTVQVEFTTNKPITITIDEDDTNVTLILAPRIERRMNDDD